MCYDAVEVNALKGICNFIPTENGARNIACYHFVYETNLQNLTQPFLKPYCIAYLAFRGEGTYMADGVRYRLSPGTLFFALPGQSHEILSEGGDFTYMYIAFGGEDAETLLQSFQVRRENAVFEGFTHLVDFWLSAIRRISAENAAALTESVLLYTLSFLGEDSAGKNRLNVPRFESILDYLHRNFADPEISIRKVADIFFYNEKYLSSLFLKNTGVKFTAYLTNLRMEHAVKRIRSGEVSVSRLAAECGFADPLYFSKVFRKHTGYTPSEYRKKRNT